MSEKELNEKSENNEINEVNKNIENINDLDETNKSTKKLITEFDEYFKNNITDKDENIINSLNIDNIKDLQEDEVNKLPFILNKDQFYQSFVLFQKYLYWNMHKNYMQNVEQSKHTKNKEEKNKNSIKINNNINKKN